MKNSLKSFFLVLVLLQYSCSTNITERKKRPDTKVRERISLNSDWKFFKYDSIKNADDLIYEVRPAIEEVNDSKPADAEPTEAVVVNSNQKSLKPWILPTGNVFLYESEEKFTRPSGNPGKNFDFTGNDFDDTSWENVTLPHDWAIDGPFFTGENPEVGGGMGRLPSPGIGWYRKSLDITKEDKGKIIYLDIDGAMSYSMVWLNGNLVGGWPYGYSSYRLDLTPYINYGEENQIAIRIDNPYHSSRWYPGGGIYRNVWLVKTYPIHVDHWGTFFRSSNISDQSALIKMDLKVSNNSGEEVSVDAITRIFLKDSSCMRNTIVAEIKSKIVNIPANLNRTINDSVTITNPKLWGPLPDQKPNMYVAETSIFHNGKLTDLYDTSFGIRNIEFDGEKGLIVNGEEIFIKGVNQHHDLGALGAAFNKSAAKRQLVKLRELGANAIRIAHNPPAPELLDLTDEMGFLVVNEIFDGWVRKKNPHDFNLIFNDWYKQDIRAWVRRDRNNPSVILWSTGNEVGEQYTGEAGAKVAQNLRNIVNKEDPTRPTTASFNYAKPDMPITAESEVINLNYQGEGIRNAPAYSHLEGINTPPLYPKFHEKFPNKTIISSENAAAVSTRGTYIFPVFDGISAPVSDSTGGDPENRYVSSYELYSTPFGSSADKVFKSLDQHPYVAGGFVWSGWDYLGEPTPYYLSRSSYFGIIDLAGFKKDRYYLYQSRWRPDLAMAHILPHWNWPERIGKITPVHVFTSGDEAELFLNGKSLGRKHKSEFEYRLRWDNVIYEPGELKVITYKDGKKWATDNVRTSKAPSQLSIEAEKSNINLEENELAFINIQVEDEFGNPVATANNEIVFTIEGPAEIVATDNGDPTDMTAFPSHTRKAFSGKALVIVRPLSTGEIIVQAKAEGMEPASVRLKVE